MFAATGVQNISRLSRSIAPINNLLIMIDRERALAEHEKRSRFVLKARNVIETFQQISAEI